MNAASAALATSNIPWNGPIGAVRVGYLKGKIVMNPQRMQLVSPDNLLNIVVAGTSQGYTVMLEAEAKNLDKSLFLDGISFGLEGCSAIAREIHAEVDKRGRQQRPVVFNADTFSQVEADMALLCEQKLKGSGAAREVIDLSLVQCNFT